MNNNCNNNLELTDKEVKQLEKIAKKHKLFFPFVLGNALWKKRHKDCFKDLLPPGTILNWKKK